ncbi:Uncharacterised protein [Mycobacteroides abscessus subsp. abscessus]|nr:Uncharacterised protein [Mycobacteroides abscessus subsp. abscessus]
MTIYAEGNERLSQLLRAILSQRCPKICGARVRGFKMFEVLRNYLTHLATRESQQIYLSALFSECTHSGAGRRRFVIRMRVNK